MGLHPHLKSYIKNVVQIQTESAIGPSKNYLWKEHLMGEVQKSVMSKLGEIGSQEELVKAVDEGVSKLRDEVNAVLDMVANTLKQIPVGVLQKLK